jgi:hypothetical protein
MDLDELLKSIREEDKPKKGGAIVPAKLFGKDRYEAYLGELTANGTIGGERLSSSERKEAFKKRTDKIGFEKFVDKVLAKKQTQTAGVSRGSGGPQLSGGGALVKSPAGGLANFIMSPVSEETQENFDDILKGIDSILDTLKEDQKIEKKSQEIDRKEKEKEKRKEKEGKLESKAFKGLGKKVEKVIAPVKSLFEKLFEFLGTVLLGRIIVKIVEWFSDKENKRKVELMVKFFQKTGPALLAAYLLFGNSLGRLVVKLSAMALKWTIKLGGLIGSKLIPLAKTLGIAVGGYKLYQNAFGEDEESSEFSGGGKVPGSGSDDTVPAMLTPGEFVMSKGAVSMFGTNTLASMNAAGGGTNIPVMSGGTIFAQGGGYIGEKNEKLSPSMQKEMEKRKSGGILGNVKNFFAGIMGGGNQKASTSSGITPIQKQALGILAKYESGAAGYNAVNQIGTAGGRGVKGFSGDITRMPQHRGRPLTDFTIAEIKQLQYDDRSMSDTQWIKAGKLHAVGKYQFIGNTLPGVAKRAGIPDNAKFSEGVQDLMALQLMKEKGISPWVGPSDKATPAERSIIEQARGQDVNFNPSIAKGSTSPRVASSSTSATKSTPTSTSTTSTAPTLKPANLAKTQKSISMPGQPVTMSSLGGMDWSSLTSKLNSAVNSTDSGVNSSSVGMIELPNFDAAIMHSPSKVKTIGVPI